MAMTSTVEVTDNDEYLFQGVTKTSREHITTLGCTGWKHPRGITGDCGENDEGLVMGLSHKNYDVRGLQFHPESIMTPEGPKMIANWIKH